MDARFTRLEEKLTFVEHQLGELDGVVRDLGDTLDRLGRRLDHLAGRVDAHDQALSDPAEPDPSSGSETKGPSDQQLKDQRPPHW